MGLCVRQRTSYVLLIFMAYARTWTIPSATNTPILLSGIADVLFLSALVTTFYVLPLALVTSPRNHPSTIVTRLLLSTAACTITWLPLAATLWARGAPMSLLAPLLGLSTSNIDVAPCISLALTATLFAGPLLHAALTKRVIPRQSWLLLLRNLVAAPLTEEWAFRACLVPLWLLHVRGPSQT